MFNKDSALVRVWVNLVLHSDLYDEKDVPALSNLQEVVAEVLKGGES